VEEVGYEEEIILKKMEMQLLYDNKYIIRGIKKD
jgi:hypothetical protein